jgi:tetratricopeptide (TPR) repeat protein
VHWGLGHYRLRKAEFDAAIEAFQKAIKAGGGHVLPLTGLGYAYARSGKSEKALEVVAELNRLSQNSYVSPVNVATVYAGLGDKDQAFDWLEKAFDVRSRSLAWLNVLPEFDDLRTDQRFKSLSGRIGLPE